MRLKAHGVHLGIANTDFSKTDLKIRFFTKKPTFWLGVEIVDSEDFWGVFQNIAISTLASPVMMALCKVKTKLIDEIKSPRGSFGHCKD